MELFSFVINYTVREHRNYILLWLYGVCKPTNLSGTVYEVLIWPKIIKYLGAPLDERIKIQAQPHEYVCYHGYGTSKPTGLYILMRSAASYVRWINWVHHSLWNAADI